MADPATIKSAIQKATEYLTANPTDAVSTDNTATATMLDGLRFETRDTEGTSIITDMVRAVGGEASAPSPGWLMRAAVASCDATLIAMHAATAGISLSRLEVTVDSVSNDLGILGIDASVPKGPLEMRARVTIASPDADEDRLRALVEDAIDHCPVCDAVKRAVPMKIEVEIAG